MKPMITTAIDVSVPGERPQENIPLFSKMKWSPTAVKIHEPYREACIDV